MSIKLEMPGVEKVDKLIVKHREILDELEKNLCEIYREKMMLEAVLNWPPEGTGGQKG